MMSGIFVVSDNIVSPLGNTTAENFAQLKNKVSGIQLHHDSSLDSQAFYASLFSQEQKAGDHREEKSFTLFEKLLIASMRDALEGTNIDPSDARTILIISSTKGNISLLEENPLDPELEKRMALHYSASRVASHFKAAHQPVVISHACISGSLAIITGMRLLQSGQYDHAVIAGADLITRFVLSGFQSFQAISAMPCKPFDVNRNGITLGEGAATLILSRQKPEGLGFRVLGGSVTNDANHISGPSRSGEELALAIRRALREAGVEPADIDFISAHGTATLYNDEMESKAIALARLQEKPVNSLKGYYGHTLGASGLIESVVSIQSLKENLFLGTPGFSEPGTSQKLDVSNQARSGNFKKFLKTASGFGGCNAALVISKEE